MPNWLATCASVWPFFTVYVCIVVVFVVFAGAGAGVGWGFDVPAGFGGVVLVVVVGEVVDVDVLVDVGPVYGAVISIVGVDGDTVISPVEDVPEPPDVDPLPDVLDDD